RDRRVERHRSGQEADRSIGAASRRDEVQRSGRAPQSAAGPFGRLSHDRDRTAADLRTRTGTGGERHAGAPPHQARGRALELSFCVARPGRRDEHSVSDEHGAGEYELSGYREVSMVIKKIALPRRTFIRGMGAVVALPFLDAMVPALSAMGKAAPRFAA